MSISDQLTDLGKMVGRYAPLLGAILPIPGGAAIGQLVAAAFNGNLNNPADLVQKIQADPDAQIKLMQIQSNEKIEIERLAVDQIRAQNEDRASARNREIEVDKTSIANRDTTPSQLAKIFISGYFILSFLVIFLSWSGKLEADEMAPIIQILKDMGFAIMLILAYFYGSSNRNSDN